MIIPLNGLKSFQVYTPTARDVAAVAGLTAVAAVVTQVAATTLGLFALPVIVKSIFFTTAFTVGVVTFSHFALLAASIALIALAIAVVQAIRKKRAAASAGSVTNAPSSSTSPTSSHLRSPRADESPWTKGFNDKALETYRELAKLSHEQYSSNAYGNIESFKADLPRRVARGATLLLEHFEDHDSISFKDLLKLNEVEAGEDADLLMQAIIQLVFVSLSTNDQEATDLKDYLEEKITDIPSTFKPLDSSGTATNILGMCQRIQGEIDRLLQKGKAKAERAEQKKEVARLEGVANFLFKDVISNKKTLKEVAQGAFLVEKHIREKKGSKLDLNALLHLLKLKKNDNSHLLVQMVLQLVVSDKLSDQKGSLPTPTKGKSQTPLTEVDNIQVNGLIQKHFDLQGLKLICLSRKSSISLTTFCLNIVKTAHSLATLRRGSNQP